VCWCAGDRLSHVNAGPTLSRLSGAHQSLTTTCADLPIGDGPRQPTSSKTQQGQVDAKRKIHPSANADGSNLSMWDSTAKNLGPGTGQVEGKGGRVSVHEGTSRFSDAHTTHIQSLSAHHACMARPACMHSGAERTWVGEGGGCHLRSGAGKGAR
jgi:hypothetical protein